MPSVSIDRALEIKAETALEIARLAADLALSYFERRSELVTDSKKSPLDLVSEADGHVEVLLKEKIAAAFPEDGFFGEETGGEFGKSTWLVDPIDGTTNFLSGLPLWGISIAFISNDEPLIGVIALPALRQEYLAVKGGGATCNGRQIRVSDTSDPKESRVIFGRSTDLPSDKSLAFATDAMTRGAAIYAFGCCAFNLTCVASGACDCYYEERVYPWDCGAGSLLVREAGGEATFSVSETSIAHGSEIFASNDQIDSSVRLQNSTKD